MHKKAFTAIGFSKDLKTDSNLEEFNELWSKFNNNIEQIEKRKGNLNIGIYQNKFEDGLPLEEFNYTAAAITDDDANIPDGMNKIQIPESDYTIFTHLEGYETLNNTYKYIYDEWLKKSDHQLAQTPSFTMVLQSFLTGAIEIEIHVPIIKSKVLT